MATHDGTFSTPIAARWASLLGVLVTAGAAGAAPPLRYAITPGNQLVYERRVQVESAADGSVLERYTQQLQIWALKREEGQLLLIAESLRALGTRPGPARGVVFRMDYRGRRQLAGEVRPVAAKMPEVFDLLPVLPPAFDAGRQWRTAPDLFGRTWRCTRRGSDPAQRNTQRIDYVVEDPTGISGVCQISEQGSFWFDPDSGRVVRLESRQRDRRRRRRTRVVVRLFEERQVSPEWCRQRAAEANKYLYTLRLEQRLRDRIGQEPGKIDALLGGLDRIWTERLRVMPSQGGSPLRRWARDQRRRLRAQAEVLRAQARVAARWLARPASLPAASRPADPDAGAPARYVVVCYWRSDCIDSLRALQTLRAARAALPAEKFRLACAPADAAANADEIAPLCGDLPLVPLAGGDSIPAAALPAFRVLTPDGRTLRAYFGAQPALADKLRTLAE